MTDDGEAERALDDEEKERVEDAGESVGGAGGGVYTRWRVLAVISAEVSSDASRLDGGDRWAEDGRYEASEAVERCLGTAKDGGGREGKGRMPQHRTTTCDATPAETRTALH